MGEWYEVEDRRGRRRGGGAGETMSEKEDTEEVETGQQETGGGRGGIKYVIGDTMGSTALRGHSWPGEYVRGK